MSRRTLIHSSGRFDRSQASLRRSVLALREQGSLITHTELSSVPLSLFDGPGWEAVRVPGSGKSEYVIEHDTRVFTRLEAPTAHRLSSLFYYRASGSRAAFFYAVTVPYLDIETGAKFVVLVTHAPLDNTKRRAGVWVSQAAGWVRLVKALRLSHPGYAIIGLGDWNKNYRTSERAAIEKHMAAPAGLRQSWDGQLTDDKGGSHGSSQIIDGALTDAKVLDCDLLPDDDSSDHRPVGVTVEFAAAPVAPPPTVPAVPVAPVPTTPEVPMATSQNGYTANDRGLIESMTVPGTSRKIALRRGAPGQLLCEFAGWFDKNVESVDGGILDDWGYAERPIRGSSTTLSNHASGTAIDLNAPRHPLGARNTFTDAQEKRIRAELKRYDGAIRWGGDYQNRADEMHFEIVASPEKCAAVLAGLNSTAKVLPKEKPLNAVEKFRAAVEAALKDNPVPADRRAARAMVALIRAALKSGPKR